MKILTKLLASLVLVVSLMGLSATRTSAQSFQNAITVGVGFISSSQILIGQYEFSAGRSNSLAIRAEYVTDINGGYAASGFGASYRFFFTDDAPVKGFAVAPAIDAYFFSNSTTDKSTTIISVGVDGSYEFQFGHFALQPFIQIRIGVAGEYITAMTKTHFVPGLNVGYAW